MMREYPRAMNKPLAMNTSNIRIKILQNFSISKDLLDDFSFRPLHNSSPLPKRRNIHLAMPLVNTLWVHHLKTCNKFCSINDVTI